MMPKKHFESIAKILHPYIVSPEADGITFSHSQIVNEILKNIARDFADYLEKQNESFDRNRFYQACGYEQGCSNPY